MARPNGFGPLYARVEKSLLARIATDFKRGDLLPTQTELAKQYKTSLITIKRAIGEIARKGYLQSTRGLGTVVLRPQVRDDRGDVASWTDVMTGAGRQPATASVRVVTRVPPPVVARALGLAPREKSVVVERVRSLDDEPFCLMWNELPLALVPDLAREGLTAESVYTWIKKRYGLEASRADEEVTARAASAEEQQALGTDTEIVVVVERHSFLADGRPLELSHLVAPADRYRYRIDLVRRVSKQ